MTLRITTLREARGDVVVVDGRLDAGGLDDLERVVADLPGLVRVELAGLRSADEMALDALRALRARGVALTGVSQYFRILLGAAERRRAREPPSPPRADAKREEGKRSAREPSQAVKAGGKGRELGDPSSPTAI